MKFTLSWLKDYLDTNASLEEISECLTSIGLEVEEITDRGKDLQPFKVARINDAKPHPDADKLRICEVDSGDKEPLQIVCGAPNARAGIYVVLAPIGTVIPTNGMKIKPAKIRGVESCGMLCSAAELGLGADHAGIMELDASHDNIAQPFVELMGLNDPVIDIAITPNRGDCLGVYGIARDLAAAGLGVLKPLTIPTIAADSHAEIAVTLEDRHAPAFLGCLIKGVNNGDSPSWLAQRLLAIGVNPISKLIDVTNYISYSFARPLHVYDAQKLSGDIVVRGAKEGEKITALDEKEYRLEKDMLVVADQSGPQAIAGIIGGAGSGCSLDTKDVFLELALFDAENIASTGRALGVLTDSRYRFERHVDPNFMEEGYALAVDLILELCGGSPSKMVRAGSMEAKKRVIDFKLDAVHRLTGVSLEKPRAQAILKALGFVVDGDQVTVPSFRADVEGEADLVEEIIRIHGYHHIPLNPLPVAKQGYQQSFMASPISKARHVLAARGFDEVVSWSFMSEEKTALFRGEGDPLRLQNPINKEMGHLRSSALPHLLDMVVKNSDRGYQDLSCFEIGPVFHKAQPDASQQVVTMVQSGHAISRNPHELSRVVDFFDMKADLWALGAELGLPLDKLQLRRDDSAIYHPGKSAVISLGKEVLGRFGLLHPSLLAEYGIEQEVAAAELYLDRLPVRKRKTTSKGALVLSDYQAVSRDFAFLLDADRQAGEVISAVQSADKQLIQSVDVFDLYQGKHIEEGKKSLALSVTLQAKDRTLTEEEIEYVSQAVIQKVADKCGGAIRG